MFKVEQACESLKIEMLPKDKGWLALQSIFELQVRSVDQIEVSREIDGPEGNEGLAQIVFDWQYLTKEHRGQQEAKSLARWEIPVYYVHDRPQSSTDSEKALKRVSSSQSSFSSSSSQTIKHSVLSLTTKHFSVDD